MYINCHTYYSLRYGTLSPEELAGLAASHGLRRIALTDINNSSAMPDFVRECSKRGLEAVAGMEFRKGDRLLYIVLARNPKGFGRINAFRSLHNTANIPLPPQFPVCENTFVIYPFSPDGKRSEYGPNEYTGIRSDQLHMPGAAAAVKEHPDRMLALHPVSFSDIRGYRLHLHLRAIDHNILLSRLNAGNTGRQADIMLPPRVLRQNFATAGNIINNTIKLLDKCSMDFEFGKPKNKKSFTGSRASDRALLEKLATEGMLQRYGAKYKEAHRRIRHELDIIDKLGFSSYFLITWDIIRYSMSRGFYHVGRGSGANSTVAYCLHITDVDPAELNLYFERFINPKRSTPPDFDIDYSWKDRDQVLDYIFKRYGNEHTALLGTISTFHRRSAIREAGKAYGLPKSEIDMLAGQTSDKVSGDRVSASVLDIAGQLAGLPNIRSIHAGGVLISEEPVYMYSALDLPAKGLPSVQWDMYVAEDLGFEKIDILSQRGIGHINECVRLVSENRKDQPDIHNMAAIKEDPKTLELLKQGQATGCFYIESPAMRGLLKKLLCSNYIELVAASSIIRPGVSRSGMMQEYIKRRRDPSKAEYLHPVMEEQLKETYGVMVYQEDVIRVCHHFAGLDLADADILRRAMSGKYRSEKEMLGLAGRFFKGCREKERDEKISKEIWRQIKSFAGYSFSKAHSASFAVESFQSLYLKGHYPLEFMTAVLNNFGGFYRSEVYFHEAKRLGARIELPCVNSSEYLNRIKKNTIYTGFVNIQDIEQKTARLIVMEREENGLYSGLEDFVRRTGIKHEQLVILIRIKALRFTGTDKYKLLWRACMIRGKTSFRHPELFSTPYGNTVLPEPENSPLTDAYDEIQLLGFTLSSSPFDLLKTSFRGDIAARDMISHNGRDVRMVGWLVNTKYVRTVKGETMYFGCFIDAGGDFFDTIHFPDVVRRYPFSGKGVYLLIGQIQTEFSHPGLKVLRMARLPFRPAQSGLPGSSAAPVLQYP